MPRGFIRLSYIVLLGILISQTAQAGLCGVDFNAVWRRLSGSNQRKVVDPKPSLDAWDAVCRQVASALEGEPKKVPAWGLAPAVALALNTLRDQRNTAHAQWQALQKMGDPGVTAARADFIAKDDLLREAEHMQGQGVGYQLSGASNPSLRGRAVHALEQGLNSQLGQLNPSQKLDLLTKMAQASPELSEGMKPFDGVLRAANEKSYFRGSMQKAALTRLANMESSEGWRQVVLGLSVSAVTPRGEQSVSEHAEALLESGPWTQAKQRGLENGFEELSKMAEKDPGKSEGLERVRRILAKPR
jgi:hypothetical protein